MSWESILLGWEALGRKLSNKAFQWSAAAIVALFMLLLFAFGGIAFLFLVLALGIWSTALLWRVVEEVDAQLAGFPSQRHGIPKKRSAESRRQAVPEVEEELDRLNREVESSRKAKQRLQAARVQMEADRRGQLRSVVELAEKILAELGRSPQDGADPLTGEQIKRVEKLVDAAIQLSEERITHLKKVVSSSEAEIQAEIDESEERLRETTNPSLEGQLTQLLASLRSELELYQRMIDDLQSIETKLDLIESILWRIHYRPRTREDAFREASEIIDKVGGTMEAEEMIESLR